MTQINISLDPRSEALIKRHGERASVIGQAIEDALRLGLAEIAAHLQTDYMRGGSPMAQRGGLLPLAVRSGALLGSVRSQIDRPLSGFVGAGAGAAGAYARVILGDGTTTIVPRRAKHLWIPVGQNLTRSGQTRMSPRAAMELRGPKGGRQLKIFRSRSGNLVAVLMEGKRTKARRGRVMFVLKDSVQVKGTDALAKATDDKRQRVQELIQDAVQGVM